MVTRTVGMYEINLLFRLRAQGQLDVQRKADRRESIIKSKPVNNLDSVVPAFPCQLAVVGACDERLVAQPAQEPGKVPNVDALPASVTMDVGQQNCVLLHL